MSIKPMKKHLRIFNVALFLYTESLLYFNKFIFKFTCPNKQINKNDIQPY